MSGRASHDPSRMTPSQARVGTSGNVQGISRERSLVEDDPDSERIPARTVCAAFSLLVLGLVRCLRSQERGYNLPEFPAVGMPSSVCRDGLRQRRLFGGNWFGILLSKYLIGWSLVLDGVEVEQHNNGFDGVDGACIKQHSSSSSSSGGADSAVRCWLSTGNYDCSGMLPCLSGAAN